MCREIVCVKWSGETETSLEGPRGPVLAGQSWKRWAASGEGDSDDRFFLVNRPRLNSSS